MTFKSRKMKYISISPKMKTPRLKIMEEMMTLMMNFSGTRKWEISATSTVASWTWDISVTEMVSFWRSWISVQTGSFRLDLRESIDDSKCNKHN